MGYSNDLRVRVIQVVEGVRRRGCRPPICYWRFDGDPLGQRWRETGSFEAKTNKGRAGRR